ncbi:MAG: recombinase family protein, partial [Anaerolineae bacterium]|nr:recombinase family protein [Anaerolineae bacterium]
VLAEYREDETGTIYNRPELDQLRVLAENGGISAVICLELDRWARGMVKQMLLEEEFKRYGVTIVYVLDEYDDTPEGRLNKNVRATIAEYEREKTLERTKRGKWGRAEAGYIQAPVPKYGYSYVKSETEHKAWYEIAPDEAKVVIDMFRWLTEGDERGIKLGIERIANRLSAYGIPTRRDKYVRRGRKLRRYGEWGYSSVRAILTDPIYTGKAVYGATRSNGNGGRESGDKMIYISVPPIISQETFDAAQRQMIENRNNAKRNTKYEYLMRRKVYCGACGGKMSCAPGRSLGYYVCRGRKMEAAGKRCGSALRAPDLDFEVWEYVKELLKHPDKIETAYNEQHKQTRDEQQRIADQLAFLEGKLLNLSADRERLLDLYLSARDMSKELIQRRMAEIDMEAAKINRERNEILEKNSHNPAPEKIAGLLDYAQRVAHRLEVMAFDERREVIERLHIVATIVPGDTPRILLRME